MHAVRCFERFGFTDPHNRLTGFKELYGLITMEGMSDYMKSEYPYAAKYFYFSLALHEMVAAANQGIKINRQSVNEFFEKVDSNKIIDNKFNIMMQEVDFNYKENYSAMKKILGFISEYNGFLISRIRDGEKGDLP